MPINLPLDIITIMTFIPCLGVILLFLAPAAWTRIVAFACSILPLGYALKIIENFDSRSGVMQFLVKREWIPSLNVYYHVGIDGLSLAMVLLVSILAPLTILGAFRWVGADQPKTSLRTFYALLLLEQSGLYGAFTALNFFHWFIFWEASLVPMFFLIKLFGNENRTEAAYQFFVYTFIGSVAMLLGMQFIYMATKSWDFIRLAQLALPINGGDSELVRLIKDQAGLLGVQFLKDHSVTLIGLMVFIGFAVKVPLWPFHTWLPITYTQAPTAGSMILTGLMSKMGVYGILRVVLPLFGPTIASHATFLLTLSLITILFGALSAFAQRDFKTVIAYSSISHLGYCLFGIFAATAATGQADAKAMALNGVIFQMFAHGLSAAGLFYFMGLIEQRTQTREISDLGGLRKSVPVMCGLMGIVMFASLGLPGLAGFVGEYMIFQGSFGLAMGLTAVAVVGILFTALYLLRMTSGVFFGPQDAKWSGLTDLSFREAAVGFIFVLLLFAAGILPSKLIEWSNAAVMHLALYCS